jgi:2-polyprenyl-6-hydroxyphenyl methylase/3-demethylubiquinone-9 3-methyltransferase
MNPANPSLDPDLKDLSTHFTFGENWASYSNIVDEGKLKEAEAGLVRLLGPDGLTGKSFLDIGCGSGIHAAAAARLGARSVLAADIDPKSVATTREMIARFVPSATTNVVQVSAFDLNPLELGTFDVVYSWGALHHTGAMVDAITNASRMVTPGGVFALALYQKTPLCRLWTVEKHFYSSAPAKIQKVIAALYVSLVRLAFIVRGRDFKAHVAQYQTSRGMDFHHDVHDWLGGYPYESISIEAADALMNRLGFARTKYAPVKVALMGAFGSGCDEYVYRRMALG